MLLLAAFIGVLANARLNKTGKKANRTLAAAPYDAGAGYTPDRFGAKRMCELAGPLPF